MQHSVGANVGASLGQKHRCLTIFEDHSYASVGLMLIIEKIQIQIWIQKNNSKNRIYAFVMSMLLLQGCQWWWCGAPPASPSSMRPPPCYFNSAEKNRDHSPDCGRSAFLCLEHYVCFCDPDRMEDDCRDICAVCECQEGVWYNNPRNQASLATSTWPHTS